MNKVQRLAYLTVIVPVSVVLTEVTFAFRRRGHHHVEPGTIIVSNHVHDFDSLALVRVFWPTILRFNSQTSNFEIPVAGLILRAFGTIPVDPAEVGRFFSVNARALDDGECVVIYPEGRITSYGTSTETFHPGAFALAVRTGAPIVPVALVPSGRNLGVRWRRPQLEAKVGPAMYAKETLPRRQAREELRQRAEDFVSRALDEAARTHRGESVGVSR
ncbi:lysophospholipid acyltransferase family protein [Cutibacterium equinum]|uniref:Lysophospholipid acyltransferase family protein n=1 Tax=Cutibacterium equinum TaxID=3016342 RepID=A0ABY7QVY6_9ACTN|nr:lysophospholipid acyltransferase family protein [Cutibacterium equinum]WCC79236.1 lysophospholipid acyltransferase family protein [Cutibacterium equinum]